MQTGDFIHIDFVGRIKDTGEVFDLTREDVAKEKNLYNPKYKYKPIPMIVDAGLMLKGIDATLKEMEVGEKRTIELKSADAFGERKSEFVRLIPLSVFREQDIDPIPGNFVTINRMQGRVVSVDGGRVNVDFNHPLAGKTLEYELEIKDQMTTNDEKVKAVVNYFTAIDEGEIETTLKEKTAEIKFKKKFDLPSVVKENIANAVMKWVNEIETVEFVDSYAKK